jgi:hypothetical protein
MRSWRRLIDPGGRALASSLDRLGTTLGSLSQRLKQVLVQTVGESVSEAVRDTLQAVFPVPPSDHDGRSSYGGSYYNSSSARRYDRYGEPSYRYESGYWQDERYQTYQDRDDGNYGSDREDHDTDQSLGPVQEPTLSRVPLAMACGLQAAASWMKRFPGCWNWVSSAVVGLVIAGVVYVGGATAAAGLTLANTAGNLAILSELAHAGSSRLNRFSSS